MKTLDEIEDQNPTAFLKEICKKAGESAKAENWSKGLPITVLEKGWVVRKWEDGRVEKVGKVGKIKQP